MSSKDVAAAARELGVAAWVSRRTLEMGYAVELEHGRADCRTDVTGDDPKATLKIVLAHLKEIPDYYDRLERMEEEGKAALEGRPAPDPFGCSRDVIPM